MKTSLLIFVMVVIGLSTVACSSNKTSTASQKSSLPSRANDQGLPQTGDVHVAPPQAPSAAPAASGNTAGAGANAPSPFAIQVTAPAIPSGGFATFKPSLDSKEFPDGLKYYKALVMTDSNQIFLAFDSLNWFCSNPTDSKSLILLREDGSLDPSFTYDHAVPNGIAPNICSWAVTGLWHLKSGQFLQRSTTGADGDHSKRFYLSRIDASGKTDRRFGVNGFFSFEKVLQGRATILTAYEGPDESLYGVVIQNATNDGDALFPSYIFHLSKDGKLDPKFGTGGLIRFNDVQAPANLRVLNGKLLIIQVLSDDVSFFQYDLQGHLLAGFDKNTGKMLANFGNHAFDDCVASGIFTDACIYAASACKSDETAGVHVSRYDFDGNLDQNYGTDHASIFLPVKLTDSDQAVSFTKITDLKNGEIAISAGIGWQTKSIPDSSVVAFHLASSGRFGNWGTAEYGGLAASYLHAPWSAVDTHGRVLERFADGGITDYWILTTPMR